MRSPSFIGSVLMTTSLLALMSPLIYSVVRFFDFNGFSYPCNNKSAFVSTEESMEAAARTSSDLSMMRIVSPRLFLSLKEALSLIKSSFKLQQCDASSTNVSVTSLAGGIAAFILQIISQTVRQLPRMAACIMTLYIGICAGYVGMVHLRLIRPDRK